MFFRITRAHCWYFMPTLSMSKFLIMCDMTRDNIYSFELAPVEFNHVIQENDFKQEFIPFEFLNYFKEFKFNLNLDIQNLILVFYVCGR